MKFAQATIAIMTLIFIHPDSRAEAQTPPPDWAQQVQSLREEVRTYRDELDAVRREQEETWLNERRAEEVMALISDVLADADTRTSLAGNSLTAGYDKGFFYWLRRW